MPSSKKKTGKKRKKADESKKTPAQPGKSRLNLMIDEELKEWAFDYADRQGTTVTQLITAHFLFLQHHDSTDDAEQL